jgi:hypothetical protein
MSNVFCKGFVRLAVAGETHFGYYVLLVEISGSNGGKHYLTQYHTIKHAESIVCIALKKIFVINAGIQLMIASTKLVVLAVKETMRHK